MALCKDPALTFLNDKGYNVVRLPRRGIAPLDVLGRDGGSLERLGPLSRIWASDEAAPVPEGAMPAVDISGQSSRGIKLSVGLKFLANVLAGLGAATPLLSFAYSRAKSLQFVMRNVESVQIDPFTIGNFLAAGDLATANPFVEKYFDDPDAEAYVISEILQSKSLAVSAEARGGGTLAVDLPAIQQAVGAQVSVAAEGADARLLVYEGSEPLTFGFKAFGIAFENGEWVVQGAKAGADMSFTLGAADAPADVGAVVLSSGMLNLK